MDDNKYDIGLEKYHLIEYLKSGSIQNVCRSCLCVFDNEELNPLIHNNVDESLHDKFTYVTSIQVHKNVCLPSQICLQCSSELVNSYMFKTKCLEADNFLNIFLKYPIKEEKQFENENLVSNFIQPADELQIDEKESHEEVEYLEDLSDSSDTNKPIFRKQEKIAIKKEVKFSVIESKSQLNRRKPLKKYCKRKKNTLECKLCSKIFFKQKTLRAHVTKDHGPTILQNGCQLCKKSFPSEHDLKVHSSIHQSENGWKCNECYKEFKDKTTLLRHLKRHMESKRYSCPSCDKSFSELYAFRRHNRVHTGEMVEKKHKCNVCVKRFNSAHSLAAHLTRHAGVRPFVCAVCGKTFPDARLLSSHRLVHTDSKQYTCDYCEKSFRHESTRNTHHRTHTGEKPYICSYCGKRFIQNSNLRLHLRTHTGERPYSCEICQKKFTSGSSLKTHKRIHTGEKPYSCEICGMRFARMDKSAHMRKHTGERPFECSVCHKKFVTASSLKEHMMLHTGEKPFECDICSTKFLSKSRLAKHIKTHQVKVKALKKSTPKLLYLQPVAELNNTYQLLPSKIQYVKKEKEQNAAEIVKGNDQNGNTGENYRNISVIMETPHEVPMEVSRELIVQPNGETKSDILVVDEANYQSNFCLASNIGILNDDVKFVTVDNDHSMSTPSMMPGTTVKFMQVDQSLLQIQSENGHVTVSKITSKMTANILN